MVWRKHKRDPRPEGFVNAPGDNWPVFGLEWIERALQDSVQVAFLESTLGEWEEFADASGAAR